ncbi:hypothetical protein KTAU_44620 [Thermogemmatispora aurantia]|uniref:Uncharacterized protein n=1 Tax=Thermogemmatispora aurantia TaxID=2045279 RepID=A0A5J4KBD2_9CHLR|nr:hypothetical protein [Thermogemmatispora aurantia]GER85828.1 hypothetical protein KTAU_44620 [Thermogemmatispora aurantia]
MSRHRHRRQRSRRPTNNLLAGLSPVLIPGPLEWALTGRTIEDLQLLTITLLSPRAQQLWQHWQEERDPRFPTSTSGRLGKGDRHLLKLLVELQQGLDLLQARCQETIARDPEQPIYFHTSEIPRLRRLLSLTDRMLQQVQHSVSPESATLQLKLGQRLIRYLARTLRDHPRREHLN